MDSPLALPAESIYTHFEESSASLLAEERAKQLGLDFHDKNNSEIVAVAPDAEAEPDVSPLRSARNWPSHIETNQILCGDNLDLIRRLPDACVPLVITSPPYFRQRDYGGHGGGGDEEHIADYLDALLRLFEECVRVTTSDGSIVFNLGDKYENSSLLLVPYRFAIAASMAFPVRLVNNITWVKQNPTPRQFRRRLVSSTEPFFHFVKSDAYYYNIDDFLNEEGGQATKRTSTATSKLGSRYFDLIQNSDLPDDAKSHARRALTDVIQEVRDGAIAGFRMKIRGIHAEAFGGQEGGRKIQMQKNGFTIIRLMGNKMKRDVIETPVETVKGCPHPAIYPVEIVSEFLRLLTCEGEVVLDPFMGSGSTAVACKLLGRKYIGYDINPDYCDYARQRVAEV